MSKEKKEENIEQLFVKYQPRIKAFIRKRVTNKEDAEDILQDVFYQLTKTIETALEPIEQVTAWLYRVTKNTIVNKGKKKREENLPSYKTEDTDSLLDDFSEILFSNEEEAPSPETEYMRSLVWHELEKALAELPSEQRKAFELIELDGIPVKEISETTGIPINTLLSRKHYATKFLRKRLKDLYKDILYS